MAEILACPDRATILSALGGGGTPEEVERIAAHLEGCAGCGAALESLLQSHDTAVALRDGTVVSEPGGEALQGLYSRLARLAPVAGLAVRGEQTVGVSADRSSTWASQAGSPADGTPSFLRPPQQADEIGRLGTYRVLKQLGAGGMGVVFLAEDTQLGRKVALKTMLPAVAQSPGNRERFLREARAAAAIEHPHIVAIFQVGEDNGVPFLAMPFLKGESLEDRLRRSRKFPVADAIRIAEEMAEGLAAAHAGGLIHRDIKPGNVWLETRPRRGAPGGMSVVKLLDFGLARAVADDTHLTQSGAIVGTPAFMAPEQARGMPVDGRADLFSLGCVLYTMLTGERPFRGDTTMGLLTALALDTPKAPREVVPGVATELSDFVMRLLAKQPDQRPASALEALDELRGLAHTAAPTAPEIVVPVAPLPKPTRARPRLLAAIAAGLLFAVLGGGGLFYGVTLVRIATNKGELVVEVDDADIEVSVKQGGATVADRKKDRTFVLTAKGGEVEFFDPSTGVRLLTKEFKLERGGKVVVRVREELAAARKGIDVGPALAANKDRKAAEWVLKNGGSVRVERDGAVVEIYEITNLPDRPFKVVRVNIGKRGPSQDALLENLRVLGGVEGLYFKDADLSDAGLERLASLPNLMNSLKEIHLYGVRITDKGLAHLKRSRKLTRVDIHGCDITDAGLTHLRELPALEYLVLVGGRITDSGLRELRGLKLSFLGLSAPITDAGIEHLLGMTTLENLQLNDTSVGDVGLGRLKALPALHSLLVRPTGKVTDAGLKTLAEFPKLRDFTIQSRLITDEGLAALEACKQLRTLRLHNTRMTDAGVVHLSEMTNLVELDLYGATIGDAGLEHLKGLKGLVGLGLSNTKVTKAGVQKLAVALPGCNITSNHGTFGPNQTPPTAKEKPFVLVRGGKPAGEFATLSGSLGDARTSDVIEVHSNGPFQIGKVELTGQKLTLKAAPGYRPRFTPHESVCADAAATWLSLKDAGLTVEGCDFVGTPPVAKKVLRFLHGKGGASCFLRNCRVLNVVYLADFDGSTMEVTDSLIACLYIGDYFAKCNVLFRNNVVIVSDGRGIQLHTPGGQTVRLENNTFWSPGVIVTNSKATGITVTASGNVFDFRNFRSGQELPVIMVDEKGKLVDWRPNVLWKGTQNRYSGLGSESLPPSWPKEKTVLAAWNKFLPTPEEGSLEASGDKVGYAYLKPHDLDSAGLEAYLAALTATARKQSGIADLGPDFTLVGPGDAYVRALAAAGKPVAKEQLRPEAEIGGPVVLLRAGKVVRGFQTISSALAEVKDGDTVELRSDRTFDPSGIPGDRGTVTVRAAPGYRPVVGPIPNWDRMEVLQGSTLILEGIHCRDITLIAGSGSNGRIARLANCSFEIKGRRGGHASVNALLGTPDGKAAEIVNCSFRGEVTLFLIGKSRVEVRNSVFTGYGTVQLLFEDKFDGKLGFDIDRCAFWKLHGDQAPGVSFGTFQPQKEEMTFAARRTLFDTSGFMIDGILEGKSKWLGSRNLYRSPMRWNYSGSWTSNLAEWRGHTGSKEEGSVEADALLFDPLAWELLPGSPGKGAGPGGKDIGADVKRIAPRPEKAAPKP